MDLIVGNQYLVYYTGDDNIELRKITIKGETVTAYEVGETDWCCDNRYVNKTNFVANKEGVTYNTEVKTVEFGAVVVKKTNKVEGLFVVMENVTGHGNEKNMSPNVEDNQEELTSNDPLPPQA